MRPAIHFISVLYNNGVPLSRLFLASSHEKARRNAAGAVYRPVRFVAFASPAQRLGPPPRRPVAPPASFRGTASFHPSPSSCGRPGSRRSPRRRVAPLRTRQRSITTQASAKPTSKRRHPTAKHHPAGRRGGSVSRHGLHCALYRSARRTLNPIHCRPVAPVPASYSVSCPDTLPPPAKLHDWIQDDCDSV